MSVIISLHEQISYIKNCLEEFNKKHKKYSIELSRNNIKELFVALVDDTLSEGLKWAKRTHFFDKKLIELIIWLEDADNDIRDIFEDMVISQFDEQLLTYMEYLRSGPWDFKICKVFGDDLVISLVGDYRILDWERRMASGEWQLNK